MCTPGRRLEGQMLRLDVQVNSAMVGTFTELHHDLNCLLIQKGKANVVGHESSESLML